MISAIYEIAELNDGVLQKSRLATAKYLEACSSIFEQGILSHSIIDRDNQVVLDNMKKGFSYFNEWHQEDVDSWSVILCSTLLCALIRLFFRT